MTLLTELCEPVEGVDKAAAQQLLESAEKTLGTADPASGDYANAQRDAAPGPRPALGLSRIIHSVV